MTAKNKKNVSKEPSTAELEAAKIEPLTGEKLKVDPQDERRAAYEERMACRAKRITDAIKPLYSVYQDPGFLQNAEGLKAALKAMTYQQEVDTPYGSFPVNFVFDAMYGDASLNMPLLLQVLIKETMLLRKEVALLRAGK